MGLADVFKDRIMEDINKGLSLTYGIVNDLTDDTGSLNMVLHWPKDWAGYDNSCCSIFFKVTAITDTGVQATPCCYKILEERQPATYTISTPSTRNINVGDILEVVGSGHYVNWGGVTAFERSSFDRRLRASGLSFTVGTGVTSDGVKITYDFKEQFKTMPAIEAVKEFNAQTNTTMFIDVVSDALNNHVIVTKSGLVLNTRYFKNKDE